VKKLPSRVNFLYFSIFYFSIKGTVRKSFSGQLKNELLFYPKWNKLIKGHVAHDLEMFKETVLCSV
jgi:hypothetical protein